MIGTPPDLDGDIDEDAVNRSDEDAAADNRPEPPEPEGLEKHDPNEKTYEPIPDDPNFIDPDDLDADFGDGDDEDVIEVDLEQVDQEDPEDH